MKFLMFFVTAISLFKFSFQANCTDDELKALGFLPADLTKNDAGTLLQTHDKLVSAGKKYIGKKLSPESLGPFLHPNLTEKCTACFMDSIKCSSNHCMAKCMSNPCSKGCQECIKKNCKDQFISCVGQEVADPCKFKK